MPEKSNSLQIDYYLELVVKRRWLLIIPFCIAMLIGIYLALTLPKIYEAKTLILVMPQRVPTDYVRSIVSTGPWQVWQETPAETCARCSK